MDFYTSHDSTGAEIPFTDWLRLPELKEVSVLGYFASEFDSGSVQVQVLVQFSSDGGWSVSSTDEVDIGSAQVLNADEWVSAYGTVDLDDIGGDRVWDGYTHARLALRCKPYGVSQVVPFRCEPVINLKLREVIRVAMDADRMLAWNDSGSQEYKLTGPVDIPPQSLHGRVTGMIIMDTRGISGGQIRFETWKSKTPLDPDGWTADNDLTSTPVSHNMGISFVTDAASIGNGIDFIKCFGAVVQPYSSYMGAVRLSGSVELWSEE